jgi:hypothetical protein
MVVNMPGSSLEESVHVFVRAAWRHLSEHRDLVLLALRELPSHLEHLQEAIERILVPTNEMIARYLEERLGPERAGEISLVVAGRGLIGMIVMVFLTQEILGAKRFLPVAEDEIAATLAQVFLHGVLGARQGA